MSIDQIGGLTPLGQRKDGVPYQRAVARREPSAEESNMNIAGIVVIGILFLLPLLGMHLGARLYAGPAATEQSDDCKDPNARPGSRAERSVTIAGSFGPSRGISELLG
jgi:hypothetical protein